VVKCSPEHFLSVEDEQRREGIGRKPACASFDRARPDLLNEATRARFRE